MAICTRDSICFTFFCCAWWHLEQLLQLTFKKEQRRLLRSVWNTVFSHLLFSLLFALEKVEECWPGYPETYFQVRSSGPCLEHSDSRGSRLSAQSQLSYITRFCQREREGERGGERQRCLTFQAKLYPLLGKTEQQTFLILCTFVKSGGLFDN